MTNIKRVFSILLLLSYSSINAQVLQYQRTYDSGAHDESYDIIQMEDQGFLLSGILQNSEGNSARMVRTDASGNQIWDKNYVNSLAEFRESIEMEDGSLMMAGSRYIDDVFYPVLWKADENGVIEFEKAYLVNIQGLGYSIAPAGNGSAVLAGTSFHTATGNEVFLAKVNSSGETVWTTELTGTDHDYSMKLSQTNDNGFYLTGYIYGITNTDEVSTLIAKISEDGVVLWSKKITFSGSLMGYDVVQTSDEGCVVLCQLSDDNISVCALMKINASGELDWAKTYNVDAHYIAGQALVRNENDDIFIAGTKTNIEIYEQDVLVIKTDATGEVIWSKGYSANSHDAGRDIVLTSDGGLAILGSTQSENPGFRGGFVYDIYLIKTNENGVSGCLENDVTVQANSIDPVVASYALESATNFVTAALPELTVSSGLNNNLLCGEVSSDDAHSTDWELKVHTNLTSQKLGISCTDQITAVKFFNLTGSLMYETKCAQHSLSINLDGYSSGSYFLQIESGKNVHVEKIMIFR